MAIAKPFLFAAAASARRLIRCSSSAIGGAV
jgi:hypothetical protein